VTAWSEKRAGELAREAMAAVGVDHAQPTLIKFRNAFATFRVERPALLLKLAAPEARDALERSLILGERLREAGVPVAAPAVEVAQGPVQIGERWAGLWHWEQSRPGRPDPAVTGRALRFLHETLADAGVPTPELDPIVTSRQRFTLIRESGVLPAASVELLGPASIASARRGNGLTPSLASARFNGISNLRT
jgi:hypothetical protein